MFTCETYLRIETTQGSAGNVNIKDGAEHKSDSNCHFFSNFCTHSFECVCQSLKKKKSLILAMANVNSTARNAEMLSRRRKIPQRRRFWVKPGRSDKWWQNMIDRKFVSDEWKKNFRMPKEQFMELVDELRPYISPSPNSHRPSITAEKR